MRAQKLQLVGWPSSPNARFAQVLPRHVLQCGGIHARNQLPMILFDRLEGVQL